MDPDYKGPLARAQAEATLHKFLESGSEDESEWLRAAVDYLKKITVALVSEFLPSNSANPDLDIQRFRGAIESTIDKLWETPYHLQPILQGFSYGLDGSKFAFQIAVRPIELERLWQNEVTDFWSRHAAYLEKRSGNEEPFPRIAETVSLPEPKVGEFCEKDAGPVNSADTCRADRRAAVDAFLLKCKQQTPLNATRKHIWRAVGHRSARQFQFWQASHPKATAQDDQNFHRILAMNPTAFVSLLKQKGIIDLT